MRQELLDCLSEVQELTDLLKSAFVGKDHLIELIVTCAIAQEHVLIIGPPGTAKSELIKRFALLCNSTKSGDGGGSIPYFEYLLTRFTEPNEIFGPVDILRFQQGGGHQRITTGMLPRAEIAFLDEVFKANSAILNALLTVLNERVFYNGGRPEPVPLLCAIGASNEVPDDPALAALYDRFLVRLWTDNVEETRFGELFIRGWEIERYRINKGYKLELGNVTTTDTFRLLYSELGEVSLNGVAREYREVIRRIRAEGIEFSDRRVIKLLKLIAAAALRRGSTEANPGDFWVLRHVWNNQDQIPHLQTIVGAYLEGYADVRWKPERDVQSIDNEINVLNARHASLRTDADYADFLQQAERLRQELGRHSDGAARERLQKRLEGLIDKVMALLSQQP
ncbi:MAG: AAA family ATPase [Pyrinomonadaceae bacterium]